MVALVYVIGFTDFFQDGRGGSARVFMLTIPFLTGLFLGRRASVVGLVVATGTMAVFGFLFSSGYLVVADNPTASDPAGWAAGTFTLLMLGTLMVVSLDYLVPRLSAALRRSLDLAEELEGQRALLEEEVAQRTADLARRGTQLEAAARVARDAAMIRDVEALLAETAELVSERFGFYHTGLFLLDEMGEYAVLRAASSEGGRRMLARGHRLGKGVGLVGNVAAWGEPRIALDVGMDAVYFDNPDLPETRSEMALPLRVREEVIGVLDVQSREPEAFGEEDVAVLQTLADQVAVAINNAQLVQQVQESLEAERRAYGEIGRDAWRELIRTSPALAQRYDPGSILPSEGVWREEMRRAVQEGRMAPAPGATPGGGPAVAVPVQVRGQVVGVLDAHKPAGAGDWSAEEAALLQAMVEQLGVALDSARLYQDTQRRAAQDRLLGEVAARMRETLDMDTVLQSSIREMGEALGLAEVEVRLGGEGQRQGSVQQGGDGHEPEL
jgi:GAF domain-containing protein